MALSIGELVGYVRLDTSGVRSAVASTRASLRQLGHDMGDTLQGNAKVTGGAVGTMLKGMGVGMLAAGVAGGVMGVKTAAGMEQARIAFSTMLGSAQEADGFLRKLSAFAASTPFEFPELQTAASSLISAGIEADKVIPIMTTLGDVTSGMGTGSEGVKRATVALQQMSAAGRITGEDLNQLRDAGIPVYDLLAKATGKSKAEVVKLAQAGKLGKKELGQMMKALETGKGLERFHGLMAKQSKSLTGMWSTFTDTMNMKLAKAIKPLIPLIKQGLGGATTFLAAALPKVTAALLAVVTAGMQVTAWLSQHKAVTVAVVTVLVAMMALWAAAAAAAAIGNVVAWVTTATAATAAGAATERTVAQMAFRWAWMAAKALLSAARMAAAWLIAMGPVGIVIAIVVGLVALIVTHWDLVKRVTAKVWHAVTAAVSAAWNAIVGWVKRGAAKVASFVRSGMDKVHSAWTHTWAAVKAAAAAVWSAIVGLVKREIHAVLSIVSGVRAVVGKVREAFGSAKDAAVSKLGALVSYVRGVPRRIVSAIGNLGRLLYGAGKSIVQGLIDGVQAMIGTLTSKLHFITSLIPKHKGPMQVDARLLTPNGKAIMDGLVAGITSSVPALQRTLAGITSSVPAMAGHPSSRQPVVRERTIIERRGPLIGNVHQQPGESTDSLAERLWFKQRSRG